MTQERDGALLYYMSCRDNATDKAVSNAAALEFHRRYGKSLLDRCRRICSQYGGIVEADDLLAATLAKAIDRAQTYDPGPTGQPEAPRTVRWLAQIARNLLIDSLRNPKRSGPLTGNQEPIPIEDYSAEDFAALYCDDAVLPRDARTIRLVQEGLETLDERTRRVMAHTVLQRQRSPKGSYVFRGEMARLAKEMGTTPVNLRRIRARGMEALANYVRSRTGQV